MDIKHKNWCKSWYGFEQYQDVFVNFDISNYYEKLVTSDIATDIKKQEGDYFENLFLYSITLNKLNQNFNQQMVFSRNLVNHTYIF